MKTAFVLLAGLWGILAGVLAAPALAQHHPLPALYAVTDVAAGDVLNIRAEARASSDKIGALFHGTQTVEVIRLSEDGKWGQVNIGEGAGWVAMRYLSRHPGQDWGTLPDPLTCYGTEPFWGLSDDGAGALVLDRVGMAEQRYRITMTTGVTGRSDRFWVRGEDGHLEVLLTLRRAVCNDGMSDRQYGLDIDALIDTVDGQKALSGCCSIAPN